MEDKIKIYKYLVIFLWFFSIAGVIYYYARGEKCPEGIAGGCRGAASLNISSFTQQGANYPDVDSIRNSKKEILDLSGGAH